MRSGTPPTDTTTEQPTPTGESRLGGAVKVWLSDLERFFIPAIILMLTASLTVIEPTILLFSAVTVALLAPSVIFHEWGHYIQARRQGIAVKEFSFGFGKRLWSRRSKKTGVLWSIKAIPLGGSVDVGGMTIDAAAADNIAPEHAYIYASTWTRFKIVMTGVVMNVAFAWLVLTFVGLGISGEWTLPNMLLAPLAALLVLLFFAHTAVMSLFEAVTNWDAGVSSVLSMPENIQSGLISATDGGMNYWVYYGMVLALINLSLALFNALPLYPLDGYHGLVAVLDGIRNRRARKAGLPRPDPLRVEQLAIYTKVTGVVLVLFLISVFGRDIIRMLTSG